MTSEHDEIRGRIRQMLETGQLPCDEPGKVWAGPGNGAHCVACGKSIEPTEIEFEVDLPSGRTLRLHRRCRAIWDEECESVVARR
jgi:hypothetical protein